MENKLSPLFPKAEDTEPLGERSRDGRIIDMGNARTLVRSQSYGSYLDGDSDVKFRHKPA